MPVAIKGSGGGSVTLDAGAAATDTTLTLPNTSGTLLQSGTAVTVAQGGTGLTTPGTAGNVLTSTGSAWASTAPSSIVPTPSAIGQVPFSTDGSTYTATQKITQGTAVTLTSQTSVDFTSIPSWVKRITIMCNGVSTSGTSIPLIQIGSGSVTTTGYLSYAFTYQAAGATANSTAGFLLESAGGANFLYYTTAVLVLQNTNTWMCPVVIGGSNGGNNRVGSGNGTSPALGGALDRVRLTTVNGTDTLDAGTVNILYE